MTSVVETILKPDCSILFLMLSLAEEEWRTTDEAKTYKDCLTHVV